MQCVCSVIWIRDMQSQTTLLAARNKGIVFTPAVFTRGVQQDHDDLSKQSAYEISAWVVHIEAK